MLQVQARVKGNRGPGQRALGTSGEKPASSGGWPSGAQEAQAHRLAAQGQKAARKMSPVSIGGADERADLLPCLAPQKAWQALFWKGQEALTEALPELCLCLSLQGDLRSLQLVQYNFLQLCPGIAQPPPGPSKGSHP